MAEEFLGDRRKALEDAFFAKHNEQLRQKLRADEAIRAQKQALSAASGITDQQVLEHLMAVGIQSGTLAALALIPLIEVAWADGNIAARERQAILSGVQEAGLLPGSVGYALLEGWLANRPPPQLFGAWQEYIKALTKTLTSEAASSLRQDLLERARVVAEAAGGILGLGQKISRDEQAKLVELERVFAP